MKDQAKKIKKVLPECELCKDFPGKQDWQKHYDSFCLCKNPPPFPL